MIFKPAILALFLSSFLTSGMLLYAVGYGVQILRRWNLHSGSEVQLHLERRTYLISTIMAYACTCQLLSFFLFLYTVDHLHGYFVGAMCAAGSLNVNQWGYPVVVVKVINFLLAGLWLIVNYADNRGYDYPLIKIKYILLLALTPFILVEAVFQANYFLNLQPQIITSCCGTLFTPEGKGVAADIMVAPLLSSSMTCYVVMAVTFILGMVFYRTGQGGYGFALMSLLTLFLSITSFIASMSIYFYELPTHHCPFCVLQREYGYIGYPIYSALLGGGLAGAGVGILAPFQQQASLKAILPAIQKKLTLISLISYASFLMLVAYKMITSNLKSY